MLGTVQSLGIFTLSVLGKSQSALIKRDARPIPSGTDPFDGIAVRATPAGQTVLAEAVAWLECRVVQVYDFGGDHDLLVAEISAAELGNDEPAFTHLRGNGFHY